MDPMSMTGMPSITGGDATAESGSDLWNQSTVSFGSSPFIMGGSGGGLSAVAVLLAVIVTGIFSWLILK